MPTDKDGRARRTLKACVICHKKKRDQYQCVPRERKRKRFTFSPSPPSAPSRVKDQQHDDPTQDDSAADSGTLHLANQGTATSSSRVYGPIVQPEHHLGPRLSSTVSFDESPVLEHPSVPAYQGGAHSMASSTSQQSYQKSKSSSYLGRLEYLRGEVPVNDDGGGYEKVPLRLSDSDVTILKVQRVADLPPRVIREKLLDAFWERCYPWSPVVEHSWIYDRRPGTVSLLLQQAMLLAGSRVSTPLPDYPSEDFYKKARVLFWMGAEEDPIITIAAACLLHWWNPQGPEQISLDSSSFWLRVCVGLAHQVGLHRDPTGRPDAGLRKRIWWSLNVRDCLINAGHGRPRAIDLKFADVSPISTLDFDGATGAAELFSAYVGISCILGDLTQSYQRKHGLQEQRKALEDRLFRWLKTLPGHIRLCEQTDGRPLKPYSFEARQIHVQYFTVLVILHRPTDPKLAPSTASLLASSYVVGIFQDFMARDELRYLGPIFTFYCLTAGFAQLSCYRYTDMAQIAEKNLKVLARALEELSKRWQTAHGSLKHLMDVREKVARRTQLGCYLDINFPNTTAQFFSDFGPDLCPMWHLIYQKLPQVTPIASRGLETAGILHGLRAPNDQSMGLDMDTNAAIQQRMMVNNSIPAEPFLEPTLLQPQEWFGPYSAGNWLTGDWNEQGPAW
ncbi:hypothetical protein ACEQ8H_001970 [Pleosporales sp. CAS-2024a]